MKAFQALPRPRSDAHNLLHIDLWQGEAFRRGADHQNRNDGQGERNFVRRGGALAGQAEHIDTAANHLDIGAHHIQTDPATRQFGDLIGG